MTRCRYCGKDTVTGSFCCEGCRTDFEAFEERMRRQGRMFLLCIVASVIVPMAIMFMIVIIYVIQNFLIHKVVLKEGRK